MNDQAIITGILQREGWPSYTNLAADRGGPTKGGITLAAWQDYRSNPKLTAADVEAITEPQAREFYRYKYILEPKFDQVRDDSLRELLVDAGVNHGVRHPSKWVQWAAEVPQDGKLGPISLAAINAAAPLELFLWVCSFRLKLYGRLVQQDRSQAIFIAGWNNRVSEFLEAAARRIEAAHNGRPL